MLCETHIGLCFVLFEEHQEFAEEVIQDDDDDGDDDLGEQSLDAEQRVREPVRREEGDTDPLDDAGGKTGADEGEELPDGGGRLPGLRLEDEELVRNKGEEDGADPRQDVADTDGHADGLDKETVSAPADNGRHAAEEQVIDDFLVFEIEVFDRFHGSLVLLMRFILLPQLLLSDQRFRSHLLHRSR